MSEPHEDPPIQVALGRQDVRFTGDFVGVGSSKPSHKSSDRVRDGP
ncbi:hypothetical protein NDI56_09440 [Haloarcula sp. S1CR25-12]|uniref:Uncharacterized protein n=1 Tax=Haloarcula saliterrae TaxID=2950534 RepID=A0ABU2FBG4_9EURY|nr:hypothetical protein [Haloarcula sp. S1CR25-12]